MYIHIYTLFLVSAVLLPDWLCDESLVEVLDASLTWMFLCLLSFNRLENLFKVLPRRVSISGLWGRSHDPTAGHTHCIDTAPDANFLLPEVTIKSLLTGINPQVLLVGRGVPKLLPAVFAGVRLLARVNPWVLLQIHARSEALVDAGPGCSASWIPFRKTHARKTSQLSGLPRVCSNRTSPWTLSHRHCIQMSSRCESSREICSFRNETSPCHTCTSCSLSVWYRKPFHCFGLWRATTFLSVGDLISKTDPQEVPLHVEGTTKPGADCVPF